jgi:hypothetical protein
VRTFEVGFSSSGVCRTFNSWTRSGSAMAESACPMRSEPIASASQIASGPVVSPAWLVRRSPALRGELRPVAAVEEVDEQAGDEPGEEGHPGHDFQAHHQHDAEDDAEHRERAGPAERGSRDGAPARDSAG